MLLFACCLPNSMLIGNNIGILLFFISCYTLILLLGNLLLLISYIFLFLLLFGMRSLLSLWQIWIWLSDRMEMNILLRNAVSLLSGLLHRRKINSHQLLARLSVLFFLRIWILRSIKIQGVFFTFLLFFQTCRWVFCWRILKLIARYLIYSLLIELARMRWVRNRKWGH